MAEFDYSQAISDARAKYESIALALDTDRLKSQEAELEQQASAPGLWDDSEHAQKVMSQLSACQSQLKHLSSAACRLDDHTRTGCDFQTLRVEIIHFSVRFETNSDYCCQKVFLLYDGNA